VELGDVVGGFQSFGGTYCLHLAGKICEQYVAEC